MMFVKVSATRNEINWHHWYHNYNGSVFRVIKFLDNGNAEVDLSELYEQGKLSVKFGWINKGDYEQTAEP